MKTKPFRAQFRRHLTRAAVLCGLGGAGQQDLRSIGSACALTVALLAPVTPCWAQSAQQRPEAPSSSAQLVMYLAFHDDLADPKSPDQVARESSRLTCVAPTGAQVTLDVRWWLRNVPGYDTPHRNFLEMFGTRDEQEAFEKNAATSALALLSQDDPPVLLAYQMAPGQPYPVDKTVTRSWKIHHVVHGLALKRRCDELGVEVHLNFPGATTAYNSVVAFFQAKLLPEGPR